MITGNEPINPTIWDSRHQPEFERDNDGLTIRQHFAAMAMQGILGNLQAEIHTVNGGYLHYQSIAQDAVGMADALIEELNKIK